MKAIRARRWILFIGILLTVAGILLGGAFTNAAIPFRTTKDDVIAVSVLPTGSSPAMGLTQEDMADISDTLKAPTAWWADVRGQVTNDIRSVAADIHAVGGPFHQFHPVDMLCGSFLPADGNADNAIVLDKDLAWQLFGTLNAVGMVVDFQGKTYAVTGVCDTDKSLPGLLSADGVAGAYIQSNPSDAITIAGMEVALPKALAGQSLQTVKNALSSQGKAVSSFLFTDVTERSLLDAETSGLPLAVMAAILTLVILALAVRIVTAMARQAWLCAKENYFRDAWRPVLWQILRMLIACAVSVGLIAALWLLADFRFYLPPRYIPGSWIDLDFYKSLIQSEAQAAIAARAYLPQSWDIAHDGAMQLSRWMNALALAGMAIYALGLRLLQDIRYVASLKSGTERYRAGGYDLASVWAYMVLACGVGLLVDTILGLRLYIPVNTVLLLCLGLSLWAVRRLYHDDIVGHFHTTGKEACAHRKQAVEGSAGA